ncbi:MAG: TonB-dependent receptor [Prevotella sp.]|jgi:TonB-linked SusC/RagA family outer membrane protein|nr:TonB-dependent receptor [Prevotella sp.]MCI2080457.1 TonB-dependent receptor [Prevotella sp.]MCI2102281.1 TonB-dependent receptor [Prevotella sp.]HCN53763.1 SusC/RagA family TonB-linked outer membrane protein [Prevotella sp.]
MNEAHFKKLRRSSLVLPAVALFVGGCLMPATSMAATSGNAMTVINQQNMQKVSGSVKDATGQPIIGAYVTEVGKKNGTVTDVDGNFTLSVPSGAKLTVSYVGFESSTFVVSAGKDRYDIVLQEKNKSLDEVVVVGYGTQKKVNLTGSVASVSSDKLANRTGSDVTSMLTGLMPGVTVIQNTSLPGSDQGIMRVRGLGTMGNASAMVVVDGVEASMSDVNPNDIENITVLKDAAASAIYGVRAANGVVLITTKHGQSGRTIVSYDGYAGWQQKTRMPKFVGSYDYARLMNLAYTNDGLSAPYSDEMLQKFRNGGDPDHYPDSDWLETLLDKNGFFTNHHVGMKGGNDRITYNVAMNYYNKGGLIENTSFNKMNFRSNLDAQINKRVKFSSNIAFYRSKAIQPAIGVSELMHEAFRETPVTPIQLSNGRYTLFKNEHNSVAYSRIGGISRSVETNFQGNMGLTVDIIDGLKARGIAALTSYTVDNPVHTNAMTFYEADNDVPVKDTQSVIYNYDTKYYEYNLQAYLDYHKTFGKHEVGGLVGYSQIFRRTRTLSASRKNIPNGLEVIDAGEKTGQTTGGNETEYALRSVFGRLTYDYDDRYLFEANLRDDGTSRFPKHKRFGVFPSFSAGWRISQEKFFHVDWIDNLKLRLSWGLLGNQETVDKSGYTTYYPYQDTYAFGYDYIFNNVLQSGVSITDPMANNDITWEKTEQWNLGIDATFFNNKLTLTADFFRKDTRDILLQLPIPYIVGVGAPMQNAGKVRNTGFEIQVGHNNNIGKLVYNVQANFSYVKNKITDLKGGDTPGQSVGDPLWAYYGYVCDGIFQSQEEINSHAKQSMGTPKPGDLKYRDLNGDNVVDSRDRKVLGSYFPKINYGLNFGLQYCNFDLSAVLQGVAGVKGLPVSEIRYAFYNGGKVTDKYLDSWTPENTGASMPRLSMRDSKNRQLSSFWVQDASFLKMRNLQLGYSLPKNIISKWGLTKLRIYGSVDNVFTITGFDGVDPEMVTGSYYPLTRNYTFGLNIIF